MRLLFDLTFVRLILGHYRKLKEHSKGYVRHIVDCSVHCCRAGFIGLLTRTCYSSRIVSVVVFPSLLCLARACYIPVFSLLSLSLEHAIHPVFCCNLQVRVHPEF